MSKDKSTYLPKSLDETYTSSNDLKLNQYDRLQSIFSEKNAGKLTQNAADKLDWLIGEEKRNSIFEKLTQKVNDLFSKVDSIIFLPKSKIGKTFQIRKKDKNRWT